MAWTNAFDIGQCAIELWEGPSFDRHLIPTSDYAARGITVAVSPIGEITVEEAAGKMALFQVRVIPSFPVGSTAVRVSRMSESGTNGINDVEVAASDTVLGAIYPVGAGSEWEPDPAQFDAPGDWNHVRVTAANNF